MGGCCGQRGNSRGTTGGLRGNGYPKCLVPPYLPPAEPPGLKVWLGGWKLGIWGLGRREFEKILGLDFLSLKCTCRTLAL